MMKFEKHLPTVIERLMLEVKILEDKEDRLTFEISNLQSQIGDYYGLIHELDEQLENEGSKDA